MALIKSISGIRGTIGGEMGSNLTPSDIVACATGYGAWVLSQGQGKKIVVGRDARISGKIVSDLVIATLQSLGLDVVHLGLSTTPTVELAVVGEQAAGGIILTASHNPKEWNALKFLNHRGEFISASDGASILSIIEAGQTTFSPIDQLGKVVEVDDYIDKHIDQILTLDRVKVDDVVSRSYRILVDCINSTGAISVRPLLERLGCTVELLYADMSGDFAHNPEPLPGHLEVLSKTVVEGGFDLGIAVDPDVDRLVFVCEDGSAFGEEYTIVAIADYLLPYSPGAIVSNLSSTKALKDIAERHDCQYYASAVGEVNVVEKMKEVKAVFGGEGNGGVIYPRLHYGRDALVGIALFLSHLVSSDATASALRSGYPDYTISKQKVQLSDTVSPEVVIQSLKDKYSELPYMDIDGLKLVMDDEWVHLRKSNTEPIIRIYAESKEAGRASDLATRFVREIEVLTEGQHLS